MENFKFTITLIGHNFPTQMAWNAKERACH